MMYYYPNCWEDFWNEDFEICPKCVYNIKDFDYKDYEEEEIRKINEDI